MRQNTTDMHQLKRIICKTSVVVSYISYEFAQRKTIVRNAICCASLVHRGTPIYIMQTSAGSPLTFSPPSPQSQPPGVRDPTEGKLKAISSPQTGRRCYCGLRGSVCVHARNVHTCVGFTKGLRLRNGVA